MPPWTLEPLAAFGFRSPVDLPADAGPQAVRLEAGLDGVPPRGLPGELLAEREITHAEVASEDDVRVAEPVVDALGVGAPYVVSELGVDVDRVRAAIVASGRARRDSLAQQKVVLQRREVVARRRHEIALLAGPVALEVGVGRFATAQREQREAMT